MKIFQLFLIKIFLYAVSGQNTIGIYITLLVLIQSTDVEQNAVNNNWLLKLQPAVQLQNWQKSNFHQKEKDLQIHNPDKILRSLTYCKRGNYAKTFVTDV